MPPGRTGAYTERSGVYVLGCEEQAVSGDERFPFACCNIFSNNCDKANNGQAGPP